MTKAHTDFNIHRNSMLTRPDQVLVKPNPVPLESNNDARATKLEYPQLVPLCNLSSGVLPFLVDPT